jgi:response regulator RpfG family c-di-GMP phosphodiesterase/serine/threonine protein kinase
MDRTGNWRTGNVLEELPVRATHNPSLDDFLQNLTESRLIGEHELLPFLADRPELGEQDAPLLAEALVAHGLLNDYQCRRVLAGQTFGLVLGNYRILDRIGSGGMGVVYKAEHIHMKRTVALKVLAIDEDEAQAVFLERFTSEMQALAVLRHPNIVLAFDAGETEIPGGDGKVLRYLVMEFVEGQDLEQYVIEHGPLPISLACDYIRQAANGLRHAHEHGLIHRDIKPSNLLVTDGDSRDFGGGPSRSHIKILDFGLARLCRRRHTEAHSLLGTVDYMAPEQARDARAVDIRADIYALGGTLHWLLTGQKPFPKDRPIVEELLARQHELPTPVRSLRPEAPEELEAVVQRMMARDPAERISSPLSVIAALNEFAEPTNSLDGGTSPSSRLLAGDHGAHGSSELADLQAHSGEPVAGARMRRVLVVGASPSDRTGWRAALEQAGLTCAEADRGAAVREVLERFPADLMLIDSRVDGDGGEDLCRRLRAEAPVAHLKLVLLTDSDDVVDEPDCAWDDRIARRTTPARVTARVRSVLRLKEAEERADRLASHLLATNSHLEKAVRQRDDNTFQARDVLIFAMAKMAELRGQETGGHLQRMQAYVRVLAEQAQRLPSFAPAIDGDFIGMLERCVLLHDIGKVAIPDHVLLKPGKLDAEERSIMESHTTLGASMLEAVARQHGASCLAFLQMAIDIVRHHHERWDGAGYPDGLAGGTIPLAARIVTIADVYDAMRSKLVYKPGLSHSAVRRLMGYAAQGHFDPALLVAFQQCEANFEQIFEQTKD